MSAQAALRVLYGAIFCVLVPCALAAWALRLDRLLALPPIGELPWAWALAALGFALMGWSMITLWCEAGGLPMNAFPPPRLALHGPYAVLAHPIYVGFVLAVAGVAAAVGSTAGLVVVAPAAAVGSAALAWGYETHDLDRRFGVSRARAWLRLPVASDGAASVADRARVVLVVLGSWILGYEAVGHLPVPDAVDLMHGVEEHWPFWPWWTCVYSMAYLLPPLAILAATGSRELAAWSRDAVFGMTVGFLIMLAVPFVATPGDFDLNGELAWLMHLSRCDGVDGRAAFPSFHMYWACMAAALLWHRGRAIGLAAWAVAALVGVSCIASRMHAVADVVAAVALAALALSRERLWRNACAAAECIANSWFQWQVGPARILIHGVYAGAAAAVGVLLIAAFDPAVEPVEIGAVALASLVGAGVWGQALVGSKRLQRPFGYFGSVVGVLIGGTTLAACGTQVWPLLAATAAAAPWVQAVGRLRCLVQGCCHGAPVRGAGGIVYRLPQSRVAAISGLGGVRVHPTPLYSITCNVVIGCLIARLCAIGSPASFVVGAYLFMQGVARFVEESYRGEAQTQHAAGLRIYQWFALGVAVLGAVVTCVASPTTAAPAMPGAAAALAALCVAVVYAVAMGVEFPRCAWPMSRLTPS